MATTRSIASIALFACWALLSAGVALADDDVPAEPGDARPTAPVLRHEVAVRAPHGRALALTASTSCTDCSMTLYTRTSGRTFFGRTPMMRMGETYAAEIPPTEMRTSHVHYYVELRDSTGKLVGTSGRIGSPHIVSVDEPVAPPPAPPAPPRVQPAPLEPSRQLESRATPRTKRKPCRLGPQLSYIRYNEPGVMKETGMMMGIAGRCSKGESLVFGIEGRYSIGWVDYDGALMTGEPYKVSNIFNTILEGRALLERPVSRTTQTTWTGYGGLGYRKLSDGLGSDPSGYDRESTYYYLPVGVRMDTRLPNHRLGLKVEYRYFLSGKQRSNLSDVHPSLPDVTNSQKSGDGVSASLRLVQKSNNWRFELEPYVHYWTIGQSKPEFVGNDDDGNPVYLVEPKNTSTEIGVNIAARF